MAVRTNDPTVLILTSLASGPKHGHALALDIEAFTGVRLGPGSLYGAITRMEEQGLIAPLPAEERRRPYELTPAGRTELATALDGMQRIVDAASRRVGAPTASGRSAVTA